MKIAKWLLGAALAAAAPQVASAQAGNPPPNGNVVFSLDGQTLPHSYTRYTLNYTATSTNTNLSLAFREDPAYFSIDNVSFGLANGPNLLTNGDFESGEAGGQPQGWEYLNLYNASAAGVVANGCGVGGSRCFYDGAVGSYDTITQAVNTVLGGVYTISFDLTDNSSQMIGSALRTADLAGINLVVYAFDGTPTVGAVPEPSTWATMILGLGMVGGLMRRRKRVSPTLAYA
jgi:hypothetical protein